MKFTFDNAVWRQFATAAIESSDPETGSSSVIRRATIIADAMLVEFHQRIEADWKEQNEANARSDAG